MTQQKELGFWSSLALGVMLVGVGSVAAVLFGDLSIFECTRQGASTNQGECELVSSGLLGSNRQTLTLASLQDAYTEESTENGLYRVVLQTTEGRIPLTGAYTSGRGSKDKAVEEIQAFINTATQEAVSVKQDDRWMWYVIGGLFSLAGCSLLISEPLKLLRRKR